MDIKVGDFIRTKKGIIGKLKRIELDEIDKNLKWYVFDKKRPDMNIIDEIYINKPYITKYSKNLIDLIEVRDIVEYQVNFLSELKVGRVKSYRNARSNKEYLGVEGFDITKIYIKSILTHEQYNANCHSI